jgi:glycosyltransferase involved in cell wall biosynthesis
MEKPLELNELNRNARGGTELMAERLYKYVDNDLLDNFQIIQSRARELDPNKKKIYWVHDLAGDPEVQHLRDGGWEKFDKIVFVSNWQQQMYNLMLGVPYSAGVVLRNAIEPLPYHAKPNDGTIRLIYTSTPHRGLNILYSVFNALSQKYDNIELDVYSSFKLYGWEERDAPYKELFDLLNEHPKINYHGAVPNEDIRTALMKADVFAYPSIWQETSCLCLIEAMSAGLLSVHSSLAALPETSMSLTSMYGYTEDINQHANMFASRLAGIIELLQDQSRREIVDANLHTSKQIVDSTYSWENRAREWEGLLRNLLTT